VIPDLIDDFIDAVDWDALSVWLQPLATVVTGLFALIAAIVAYRAVTRQIRANAENVQAQIDANAKAVQDRSMPPRHNSRRTVRRSGPDCDAKRCWTLS
jgi:hypothetical protein